MPRPPKVPVDSALREKIRELHAQGMGRNEIARQTGTSTQTVSKIVKDQGATFDRAQTAVATHARRIDRAAIRADLIDRLYVQAGRALGRLEAGSYQHRAPSGMGDTTLYSDPVAPARDEKDLAAAVGLHLANAAKLEALDGTGHDDARAMLTSLGKALGIE